MSTNQMDCTSESAPQALVPSGYPAPSREPIYADWPAGGLALSEPAGSGVSAYLHAFRRRFLLALTLGLVCAASAGALVWFGMPTTYTAVSLLRVAMREQQLVFQTADRAARSDFEIYKGTQRELLKSQLVLTAALRKPEVTKLSTVRQQIDPVMWLREELSVDFPGNAEIMRIRLTGEKPEELVVLVQAVVEAYMEEVVDVERNERRERLSDLDRVYTERQADVRGKRAGLKQLAEQLGTGDSEALQLKQQIAMQQFGEFRAALMRLQFELRRSQAELKLQEALLKSDETVPVSEVELDEAVHNDPVGRQLFRKLAELEELQLATEAVATSATARHVERLQGRMKRLEEQLETRRTELREGLQQRKRRTGLLELKRLQTEIVLLSDQEQQLLQDVEDQRRQAEALGGSSIDVEMMQAEIAHLGEIVNGVAEERERLRVELQSGSRITLIQDAELPRSADQTARIPLAALAMMAGFAVPVFGIVWWDTQSRRVNSPSEVSRALGISVIGTVPLLPARVVRRLGGNSQRHQRWRDMLTESVNGIAARLMRNAETEQTRVVLVSSAMAGEGKTTLAMQLALSLARTGCRTALVDLDLRRPSLDRVFGIALNPGVGEVVRGEAGLDETVHPTESEGLSILAAGSWDRRTLAQLASGGAKALFEELRDQYDFVIVDGSPLLPVADARFVGQHVDGVVLSVFRDISQGPKVLAARDILDAFSIRFLGAVVTSSAEDLSYNRNGGSELRLPE